MTLVPFEQVAVGLGGRTITAAGQDELGNPILTFEDGAQLLLFSDYDGAVLCELTEATQEGVQ